MSTSRQSVAQNSSAIRQRGDICHRGCVEGTSREGLTALELHRHISALRCFNVSNRATFARIFGDMELARVPKPQGGVTGWRRGARQAIHGRVSSWRRGTQGGGPPA